MAGIRSILIGMAAGAVFGCGAAPQDNTPADADPASLVEFDPKLNVCPTFDGVLVIPLDIAPGVPAQIIVRATDPDGVDSSLTYQWSAPSGDFSDPQSAITAYDCADLGPQALHVTAQDVHGCRRSLELDVSCVAQ